MLTAAPDDRDVLVRYVGVSWLPCPERGDAVGECMAQRGKLELWRGGSLVDTIEVGRGDYLLVADGAVSKLGAPLVERARWQASVRADAPASGSAIVRFGEAAVLRLDEVTGLERRAFGPGEGDVPVELIGAENVVVSRVFVPRAARIEVADGATVRRGEVLAVFFLAGSIGGAIGDLTSVRDFLNHRVRFTFVAAVAPRNGVVDEVSPNAFVLRDAKGKTWKLRRRPRSHLVVGKGDVVAAGDALEAGQRSHHRLLRAWDPTRLATHMVDELDMEFTRRGLSVPRVYFALLVRALLAHRRVLAPGDTGLRRHQIVHEATLERVQRATAANAGNLASVVPVLRGFTALARESGLAAHAREANPTFRTRRRRS